MPDHCSRVKGARCEDFSSAVTCGGQEWGCWLQDHGLHQESPGLRKLAWEASQQQNRLLPALLGLSLPHSQGTALPAANCS